jgi:hypothetical protein
MNSRKQILKFISSILIGLSLSIYYWIGIFVVEQPKLVFRSLALHPSHLMFYGPIGIVLGIIIYFCIRKSKRTFVILGCSLIIIAVLVWWLVAMPYIQHMILPPTTVK